MRPAKCVIFDLDGLLLDTETLCVSVAKKVIAEYGKELTANAILVATGKRPLEGWTDVVKELGIEEDPQVLLDKATPLLDKMWSDCNMLPGSLRLVKHLCDHKIPIAVATSTPRETFRKKMEKKPELRELLKYVVCGDEVPEGKPAPDVFLAAAKLIGADPADCLVLEDAPSGVEGAKKAGMRVVVAPSLLDKAEYPVADEGCSAGVCESIPSLLAFNPETYGLPPFDDLVHPGVIPIDHPIIIKGTVVRGLGRGSKDLGIPTANVDSSSLAQTLAGAVTGIYSGWVSLADSETVYKTAMSIGWNPFFNGKEKTAEPWILHDFDNEFYGVEIRIMLVGYIRPEAGFTTLQNLIDRIKLDGEVTKEALEDPRLNCFKNNASLKPIKASA